MAGPGGRFVIPIQFEVDAAGVPMAGAKLYFYQTGTNTPQNTYSDSALGTPNSNPVVADSAGRFGNIFLLASPSYKVTLTDASDVEVWTADPVGPTLTSTGAIPVGGMIAYGGTAAPTGFLLCFGQAVSRTTYAALFAVLGTAYGIGDGTTTFNLPDKRGRVSVGKDDMGGGAANRMTKAGSGVDGVALGAVGGNQLLATHNHTLTDPGHNHTLTDPTHAHVESIANPFVGSEGAQLVQPVGGANGGASPWGTMPTATASTGITIANATTGISIANAGTGASANVQPSQIDNWIIYTSV